MSRFVLSCTTCSSRIHGSDEIWECFKHAPKAGYKAWGVAGPLFWTPGLIRWADLARIRNSALEAGLEQCTEVYTSAFPNTSIAKAKQAAIDRAQIFHVAEELGSPLVVMTGRPRLDLGLEATIAGIKTLLPLIKNSSVKLALEPHYGSQIQFIEDYEMIFDQIDSTQVGITLDSGHLHSSQVDWKQLIHQFPERILNFHVKDHLGNQSVPLGKGEVNLRGYIEDLDTIGYEGALAVELEVVDPENLPRYCAEAYVYLSDLVLEVTGRLPEDQL
ncbi:MAG: sugar phosphate isomerase/epimerase [Brevefilum sp.]|nr:sugar phosphate isomerase/epimerase [Brevefilum sp.]